MFVTVHEMEIRADNEVDHRSRHQHFSRAGFALDPLSDMYGDARHMVKIAHFARVYPEPDCDTELA